MSAVAIALPITRRFSGLRPDVAILTIAWVLLSLASGYRWFGAGPDYINYAEFYAALGPTTYFKDERFEPMFVISAWLFKYILHSEFQFFISTLVGVSLAIKLRVIYALTKWPFIACVAYLMMFYILHEYIQVRQSLAIAFGLLSIKYYLDRHYVHSLIFIAIGILFQSSIASLGFGVILFNLLFLGRIAALIGLLLMLQISVLLSFDPVLFISTRIPYFSIYIDEALQFGSLNLLNGANVVFALMVVTVAPFVSPKDRPRIMYLIMCILAIVSFYVLLPFPVLAQRFRDLYQVFGILLAFSYPYRSFGTVTAFFMFVVSALSFNTAISILAS